MSLLLGTLHCHTLTILAFPPVQQTASGIGHRVRFMVARRKEEVDAARHRQEKREATRLGTLLSQRDWEPYYVEFCDATPIGLVDEPKVSLYERETDHLRSACRCVA